MSERLLHTRDHLLMEAGTESPRSRRGFLRTLITAPAAALATHKLLLAPPPVLAGPSPEERLKRGLAEVEAAFRDLFPGVPVAVRGNCLNGYHTFWADLFREEPKAGNYANVMVTAGPRVTSEGRA